MTFRPTVLVVDDDDDLRDMLGLFLGRGGYEVVCAESGEHALALLDDLRPDAIICDVVMPGMDGLELCAELRRRQELRSVPVILFSGADIDDAGLPGAYGIVSVTKAEGPQALLQMLRGMLPGPEDLAALLQRPEHAPVGPPRPSKPWPEGRDAETVLRGRPARPAPAWSRHDRMRFLGERHTA